MGWQSCTDKKSFTYAILEALSQEYGFSLDTPFQKYPKKIQDILIHGTGGQGSEGPLPRPAGRRRL